MTNLNLRWALWLVVVVSAIAWLAVAKVSDLDLSNIVSFLSLIPKVVTIDLVAVTIFVKWGWRLRFFRGWLVPFPDLSGTWIGTMRSDWIDPQTQQPLTAIPIMLTVAQNFFHVSCVLRTGEMRSDSYNEGFRIDSDRQLRQLAYSYSSRPRLAISVRSAAHDGSVVFDVVERPLRKLIGRYWTERKTTGEIEVTFKTRDLLEELPKRLPEHPLQGGNAH